MPAFDCLTVKVNFPDLFTLDWKNVKARIRLVEVSAFLIKTASDKRNRAFVLSNSALV
jgi:hypothetical protein